MEEQIQEFSGRVCNGVIVLEAGNSLPEGTQVKVAVQPAVPTTVGQRLMKFAGLVEGLPSDLAENHDRYFHQLKK
jgi:hypothetical protein